jgi:hypothetical protein
VGRAAWGGPGRRVLTTTWHGGRLHKPVKSHRNTATGRARNSHRACHGSRGWDGGGLAARSGRARGRQPDVAGDAPGHGAARDGAGTSVGPAVCWLNTSATHVSRHRRHESRVIGRRHAGRCSATLNSLMIRECQQINRSRYQPLTETPSTFNEGQTSSIGRISTNHRVPPAVCSIRS